MTQEDNALNITRGSTFLQEQEAYNRIKKNSLAWLVVLLWLATGLAVLAKLSLDAMGLPIMSWWLVGGFAAAGAAATLLLPLIDALEEEEKNYAGGRQGEQKLRALLAEALDDRWSLYCNVVLDDGNDDIDAVLVGPAGVFALEVKAYSGAYRNTGKKWQYKKGRQWVTASKNPTRQALRNAVRLGQFLKKQDLEVWVEARVVWAGAGRLRHKRPAARVWKLDSPRYIVNELGETETLSGDVQAQVKARLAAITRRSGDEGKVTLQR